MCYQCGIKFVTTYDKNKHGISVNTGMLYEGAFVSKPEETIAVREPSQIISSNMFVMTKKIAKVMEIDEKHKMVKFIAHGSSVWFGKEEKERIYKYRDIIGYELIENNGSVTKGGFGGAVVGGVLFGGFGAVTGSVLGKKNQSMCNNMSVRITVNDSSNPMVNIPLIVQPTKTNSTLYQSVQTTAKIIISQLQYICAQNESEKQVENNVPIGTVSTADEILKFKSLLDLGIITQAEFDRKKKELLGFLLSYDIDSVL